MNRLLVAAVLALCASPAAARTASGAGYSVELVDTGGSPLQTFYNGGTTYVLGNYGQRYNVRVVNRSAQRVEAVITVDGRDAISGDPGNYRQRGYIIDPYGSVTVEGFRQNMHSVAAFRFTSPGDSYAGRRGNTRNVGVVGVAIFKEKSYRPRPRPIAKAKRYRDRWDGPGLGSGAAGGPPADSLGDVASAEAAPSPRRAKAGASRRRPATRQNLGTQYGESTYSSVVEVPFKRRSSRPDRVLSLRYDNHDGLRSKGIIPPYYSGTPDPFPHGNRFAPPPR